MTLLLVVLVLVVAANCCFMAYLIADVTARYSRTEREPGLVLLCTVSLIGVFVRNFHIISSGYVETSINEHNTRLSDNVYAYLREHENVLFRARALQGFQLRHSRVGAGSAAA